MNRTFLKLSPLFKSGKGVEISRVFSTRSERSQILNYSSNGQLYSNSKQQFHIKENMRTFSTEQMALPPFISSIADLEKEFEATFGVVEQLIEERMKKYANEECGQRLLKCLRYNVSQDRRDRVHYFIYAYLRLAAPSDLTKENMKLCYIMGWCLEMVDAFLIMPDDIIDDTKSRRHKPTWHTLEGIGLVAINDAFMVESTIFQLLRKYFSDKDYYTKVLGFIFDASFMIQIGQSLDNQKTTVDNICMEFYEKINYTKCFTMSFILPLGVAMCLAGKDPEILKTNHYANAVLEELSFFYQAENDFYDIYGDWYYYGKEGLDIQQGKCTWMSAIAMKKANEAQKSIMRECYGSFDPEKVNKVKQLYHELGLRDEFLKFEKESYESIRANISKLPEEIPQDILIYAADRLYEKLSKSKTYNKPRGFY